MNEPAPPDGEDLIALLRRNAGEEISLTPNHRASGPLADIAKRLRALLINDSSTAAERVWATYRGLDTLGDVQTLAPQLKATPGTFAVLCRDNATALQCSEAFHGAGLAHRVRRGTADRPVAGWLGAVVRSRSTLTEATCRQRVDALAEVDFPGLPSADEAWRVLAQMDRNSRAGGVRVAEIASRMSIGLVPWPLLDEPEHPVTVSSIHRAKGLEFDQCAITEWQPHNDADAALEARILYVALTRARSDCFHVAYDGRRRWFRSTEAHDRFVKFGHETWQTFGIEIRGDDVHALEPAGSVLIDTSASYIQELLITHVRPGDDIRLDYAGEHRFNDRALPCYAVTHAVGRIGVTTEGFGRALVGRLKARRRPEHITNVRLDDLQTVKALADIGDDAGLGKSGIWLRPRLIGLGDFDWG